MKQGLRANMSYVLAQCSEAYLSKKNCKGLELEGVVYGWLEKRIKPFFKIGHCNEVKGS